VRKLCVFDLDGTLIDYDSFGVLVHAELRRSPKLFAAATVRRAHLMSRSRFAEIAHRALKSQISSPANSGLIGEIVTSVVAERRVVVEQWRVEGAYLVLLSASPEDYVSEVGASLGFHAAHGSHWENGSYRHLHGVAKLRFLEQNYPRSQWRWVYAVADSPHDCCYLARFEISASVEGRLSN
jgi:phosphoserine phosphatase